jgi:hypothetical protein
MNIPSKVRGWLYVATIIAALVLAVLTVIGIVGENQIVQVVSITLDLFVVFTSALARLNLSPDDVPKE